jgi:hypothetical protein
MPSKNWCGRSIFGVLVLGGSDRDLRMGGRVTRQCLVSAFIAALAAFGVRSAQALPPAASSLEQQAEAEFVRAGLAVRERLDREAAGDPIGARIAAHEAKLHRYRYLDLKREFNRLHPQPAAFLTVAAPRNPFIPDGSFWADSGASTTRAEPKTAGGRGEVTRTNDSSWDMYRPRLSMEGTGTGRTESSAAMWTSPTATAMGRTKDMYATHSAKRSPPMGPEALVPSAEAPRQPFLVYREQSAGPSTRE